MQKVFLIKSTKTLKNLMIWWACRNIYFGSAKNFWRRCSFQFEQMGLEINSLPSDDRPKQLTQLESFKAEQKRLQVAGFVWRIFKFEKECMS